MKLNLAKQKQLKNKMPNGGFTAVELAIVLVAIVILAAIVAYTYNGIHARSRNDVRTNAIRQLQIYIETFYSQNTYYPSRANLNSAAWRNTNLKGFNVSYLKDPLWNPKNKFCSINNQPLLLAKSQLGCYGYAPTNNGASCENNDQTCSDYTLSATLEAGSGIYTKSQLD